MSNETLGTRITRYRKRRNITQDELAEKMGVSPQAVSKWENDLSCPDISLLPQLSEYFDVTIDELLKGESEKVVRLVPDSEKKDINKMVLRIKVRDGGDKVNVNLPLGILKAALDIGLDGGFVPQVNGKDILKNIDIQALLMAAESGIIGNLVEIESEDGETVLIAIE